MQNVLRSTRTYSFWIIETFVIVPHIDPLSAMTQNRQLPTARPNVKCEVAGAAAGCCWIINYNFLGNVFPLGPNDHHWRLEWNDRRSFVPLSICVFCAFVRSPLHSCWMLFLMLKFDSKQTMDKMCSIRFRHISHSPERFDKSKTFNLSSATATTTAVVSIVYTRMSCSFRTSHE